MRMIPSLLVVVLLVASASGQEKPAKEKIDASAKKVANLQKERIDALKKAAKSSFDLCINGRLDSGVAGQIRLTLFDAELEVARTPSERVELCKEALDRLKYIETLATAQRDVGRATGLDIPLLRAMCLKVEIELERATVQSGK